jgi:hypothetical protein
MYKCYVTIRNAHKYTGSPHFLHKKERNNQKFNRSIHEDGGDETVWYLHSRDHGFKKCTSR